METGGYIYAVPESSDRYEIVLNMLTRIADGGKLFRLGDSIFPNAYVVSSQEFV